MQSVIVLFLWRCLRRFNGQTIKSWVYLLQFKIRF